MTLPHLTAHIQPIPEQRSGLRPQRFALLIMLGLASVAAAPSTLDEVSDRFRQLQGMPRERRVTLSQNLERFDKLGPAEQSAIRKLDAEIARKDPVEQAKYRAMLRRYHLWVNNLTEAQRKELMDSASDEARLTLARKFRRKELETGVSGPRLFGIRTGDFGLLGPYEAAYLLKIWNKLDAPKKAEIEKNPERARQFEEIRKQNKYFGVHFIPLPPAEEKHYDDRLENEKALKEQLGSYARRVDMTPKKAHPAGEAVGKRYELRFAEFLYFEEHKPKAVSQKNLERFSATCPIWLHTMLDPLSADDARNYLTILYRLLYPEPGEMPAEAKSATSPPANKPTSVGPALKKSKAASPF